MPARTKKIVYRLFFALLFVLFAFPFLSSDVYAAKCASGGCSGCTPSTDDIGSCITHFTSPDHCFSPSGPAHNHTITDGGGSVTCCAGLPGETTFSPTCGESAEHSSCCPAPPVCSDSSPDTPNIGAPADMSVHTFGAIDFDWNMTGKSWGEDCDGNDPKFEFQIDDDFDFSSPDFTFVFDDTETSNTYGPRSGINDYYWRVRARQGTTTPQYSNWAGPNWFLLDECATKLTVTPSCSAAWDEADFSWDDVTSEETYVLRVNYEDFVVPDWMTDHDFWWGIDDTWGACPGARCTVTIDDNSINHGGTTDFAEGHYIEFQVQTRTVDDEHNVCRNDDWTGGTCNTDLMSMCNVSGGAFDCYNSIPDCSITGPDPIYWSETATYTAGSFTDPDGDTVTFNDWDPDVYCTDSAGADMADMGSWADNTDNPGDYNTPPENGSCEIYARVNDGQNNGWCVAYVDVEDPTPSCTNFVSPASVYAGYTYDFGITASDPNSPQSDLETDWSASCTGTGNGNFPGGASSTDLSNRYRTPSEPGEDCTVEAIVNDGTWTGAACSDTVPLLDPSPVCTAHNGTTAIYAGYQAQYELVATDPNGDVIDYIWDFDDCSGNWPNGRSPTAGVNKNIWEAPATPGITCNFGAIVSDGTWTDTCPSKAVSILNPAPSLSAINVPATVFAGYTIWPTATASDPNGDTITFTWSDNCGGTFPSGNTVDASFITVPYTATRSIEWVAPLTVGVTCTLSVTVEDDTGWIGNTLTGDTDVVSPAPVCTNPLVGPASVYSNDIHTYTVTATDPNVPPDTILSDWTASCNAGGSGTFNPVSGASSGQSIEWTAPVGASTCTLDAKVKDDTGWVGNTCTKTVSVLDRMVQGWIWDSTGLDCDAAKSSNEIQLGDVTGVFTPSVTWSSGTVIGDWDPPNYAGHSYEVPGVVVEDNQILCAFAPPPSGVGLENFKYKLECLEDSTSGVISGSCASIDVSGATTNASLGYELISSGWFISLGGDVFSGATIDAGIPVSPQGGIVATNPPGEAFMVLESGTVMAGLDLSVKDRFNVDRYSEDNNRYAEEMNPIDMWPFSYNFQAPTGAIDLDTRPGVSCDEILDVPVTKNAHRLDPGNVYVVTSGCLQDAIDTLNVSDRYKLKAAGVVVVYVTTANPLTIGVGNVPIRSQNADRKMVIVSEAPIIISEELDSDRNGNGDLDDENPSIEMAIISEDLILFDTVGDIDPPPPNEDGFGDDVSVILEGPLISALDIDFLRDRGLNQNTPSEVIDYNLKYLDEITTQERTSAITNYTGLTVINVNWTPSE